MGTSPDGRQAHTRQHSQLMSTYEFVVTLKVIVV